jgi:hypothetical protein
MIDNDTDEVFTSVCSGMGAHTQPLSSLEEQGSSEAHTIANRLKLAEAALDLLMSDEDLLSVIEYIDQGIADALVSWENARGARFVFTDDMEHVIATGRGGLQKWFEEQGYAAAQCEWRQLGPEEKLSIWCDADGIPAEVEDTGNQCVERTIQGWLACVKQNGLLCVQGD